MPLKDIIADLSLQELIVNIVQVQNKLELTEGLNISKNSQEFKNSILPMEKY